MQDYILDPYYILSSILDYPDHELTVSNFMGNSIGLKRVKKSIYSLSFTYQSELFHSIKTSEGLWINSIDSFFPLAALGINRSDSRYF